MASIQWPLTGNHAGPTSAMEERRHCLFLAISTSDQVKFAAANRPFRSEAPGPRFASLGGFKLNFVRLPVKTSATMSRTISHQIKM